MNKDLFASTLEELENHLKTDLKAGLSPKEAKERLEKEGNRKNSYSLFVGNKNSIFQSIFSSAEMPFLVLLLITSLLTAAFGRIYLGLSVFFVTLLASIFCAILSLRTRKTLNSAKEYASPMVRVRRGGEVYHTDCRNLVVGDVIILGEGDLVPCDVKLISGTSITVDELFIGKTGIEKRRIEKSCNNTDQSDASSLYAGSAIISGDVAALVIAKGADVFLANYVPNGALGGRETEPEGAKAIKKTLYKVSFISASSLLMLTLLSILTLKGKVSFVCTFTMLLSSVFLINVEAMNIISAGILSSFINKLFKSKSPKKKLDNSAVVRNIKALDTLTDITDLVLVGSVGLDRGVFRVSKVYISGNEQDTVNLDDDECIKLLDLSYMYVKAQNKINGSDETTDALNAFLHNCNYDTDSASLMVRSLYVVNDSKIGYDFVCVETDSDYYRTTFVDDIRSIDLCAHIREKNTLRNITDADKLKIAQYVRYSTEKCERCLICLSESDKGMVFEGVLVLEQPVNNELSAIISKINSLSINVSVFLPECIQGSQYLVYVNGLDSIFKNRIAYSSSINYDHCRFSDDYNVYVGYSNEEYSSIIADMRKRGAKVAIYCVDNRLNEVMASADIAISCDMLKYATEKHRESVYERVPAEGHDFSARATQQTRLLSKVIVKRAHNNGGGLHSVLNALRMARCSYVALGQSLFLFVLLMSSLLTFVSMSVLTGSVLIDPLQTVLISVTFAFISMTALTDFQPYSNVLSQKLDYLNYPLNLLKNGMLDVLARVATASLVSIIVKILDVVGVFGDTSTFTLPIFICLCFANLTDVCLMNRRMHKNGKGYAWLKLIIVYSVLLMTCGLATQKPFGSEFYPHGIGLQEFIIIPLYAVIYLIAIFIVWLVRKHRK